MSSSGDTAATFCATLVDEWERQGVRHAVVARVCETAEAYLIALHLYRGTGSCFSWAQANKRFEKRRAPRANKTRKRQYLTAAELETFGG